MEKERIKFNIEVMRLATVGILTVGGGTISLVTQPGFDGIRNFLIASGMILVVVMLRFLFVAILTINKNIK